MFCISAESVSLLLHKFPCGSVYWNTRLFSFGRGKSSNRTSARRLSLHPLGRPSGSSALNTTSIRVALLSTAWDACDTALPCEGNPAWSSKVSPCQSTYTRSSGILQAQFCSFCFGNKQSQLACRASGCRIAQERTRLGELHSSAYLYRVVFPFNRRSPELY